MALQVTKQPLEFSQTPTSGNHWFIRMHYRKWEKTLMKLKKQELVALLVPSFIHDYEE